ncbi:MAG: peptidylprolyl isomerase, partial [Gemmatimonadota bacterium]
QVQAEQEEAISSQQNEELEDQAWDETVDQLLIQQELEERDIRVTAAEIQRAARFNPPPELMESPTFQDTEGNFDPQLYQEFLANQADNATLLQLEQYYRSTIPRNKLMRQVTSGIYLSDSELWRMYRDRNEEVRVRLAALDPSVRVADSEVSVSRAEIEEYYEENREGEFRVPARADFRIAALPKSPSPADTAAALERARGIHQDIVDGDAEFEEMARLESEDSGSAERGGDLGTFGRGDMVPAFEEAAFAAEEGEITEPVRSQFGFHIIRVRESYEDSVAASHILIPVERTDDSELELLMQADSLEAMTENMTLDEAAENLEVEVRTVQVNEDFPLAPGAGVIREAFDWAQEEADAGDVSSVFENDQAFYAVELVDYRPEGHRSLEEAEDQIRRQLVERKKQEIVLEQATALADEAREAGTLSILTEADEEGLTVHEPSAFTRTSSIPGVGRVPEVIGTAFGLDAGEISAPVPAEQEVYLVELLERVPADSTAWLAQREQQRQQLARQLQQERVEQWIAGLRQNADIQDRRDEVLEAAEEQQEENQGQFPAAPF